MDGVEETPAKDELGGFLVNRFGEQYLHAVNRHSFNAVGSRAVFQRHYTDTLWEEDYLHIIVGTDSGLLVEYVQNHGVPEGSRFLFIELPHIIDKISPRLADLELSERITLSTPELWHRYAQEMSLESYFYIRKLQLLHSIGSADAFLPTYRDLYRAVKADLDIWVWGLKGQLASGEFIQCQLANLTENRVPALCLSNSFKGKTAVLCAGGPSLDSMIPWIKNHREQLVVVAVSRVSRRLLETGLTPDIVCTIDPTSLSFDVSKEMLLFDPGVLLIHAYHTYPPLLSQWPGDSVYLGEQYPWPTDKKSKGNDKPKNIPVQGPTVANTVIDLLVEMGFAQIILAGLDLCFKQDGTRYANGSNESRAGPALGHVGQRVKTNSGEIADTIDDFIQSVNNIAAQATRASQRDCQLINPEPWAAAIPGVEHYNINDIELIALDENPRDTFSRLLVANDAEHRLQHYHQADKELQRTDIQLGKIKALAIKALHCNDGLFGRNGVQQDFKYKIKMDKIEKKLDKEFPALGILVKQFGIRQFLRIVRPDRDKEWQDEEIEQTGRVYYESYRDGAEQLQQQLTRYRQRLQARIEEESPSPKLSLIFEEWQRADEPGRLRVWQQRRGDADTLLGEQHAQQTTELHNHFQAQLDETDTRHMHRCRKEVGLSDIPSKLLLLFQQQDIDGMQRVVSGLEDIQNQDVSELLHFAHGFFAEANGEKAQALEHYQQVGEGPLLEDTLRRMCTLTLDLKDYESALLAFQCLAQISPSYMPQYAEFLRIIGQQADAAQIYTEYLEQAPEDLPSVIRLGKLYLEQGVNDGARWAFSYTLERDPDNQAAKTLLAELDHPAETNANASANASVNKDVNNDTNNKDNNNNKGHHA